MLYRLLVLTILLSWQTFPASAQIAGQDLPDMKSLQEVFSGISSGKVEIETVTDADGLIGSGIAVPDTGARGKMAKLIASAFAEASGNDEMAETLEPVFVQAVNEVENALPQLGFQKRDYGVGFALFFIVNWETANGVKLAPEVYKPAGEKLVKSVQAHFTGDIGLSDEQIDEQYDMFLTVPVAILTMVESFEANGQPEVAAQMREYAGQAFEQVIGIPPYDIDINDEGDIVGY